MKKKEIEDFMYQTQIQLRQIKRFLIHTRIETNQVKIMYDSDTNTIAYVEDFKPLDSRYINIISVPYEYYDKSVSQKSWYQYKEKPDGTVYYRICVATADDIISGLYQESCKYIGDEKIEQVKQEIFNVINNYNKLEQLS